MEGNPVLASCMSLFRSWGLGTMPKETEWDCSESSVGLGSVTMVSAGIFLDLGLLLFLESALEASRPYDLVSKRRAFWSLNEDILKITVLKTNTSYPSRKIRRIRASTHQRLQRNKDQYVMSKENQYVVFKIWNQYNILEDIKRGPYSKKSPIRLRMTKVMKGEFKKIKDVKVEDVSLTCDASLEVFNDDVSRLSKMDDDLFTYEVEVANIPCDSKMDNDSE
ncbi:hypothetical protein Tco_0820497 [Tanacetum coccineum]|uniref:Uncharacterized protein n=1 Tax=Tanacetum coccineum TaxID=301880 RepID=A0ABQ5ADS2_9ASTR